MKLKAAEGRHFLPGLTFMLREFFDMQSAHATLRYQCVNALCLVYAEMDRWQDGGEIFLCSARWGRKHLVLYAELSSNSDCSNSWHMYPKHHLFVHVMECCRVNPKLEWNYKDESEIGDAANMAACAANSSWICSKLLERYRSIFVLAGASS